jgi:hypothetical protein
MRNLKEITDKLDEAERKLDLFMKQEPQASIVKFHASLVQNIQDLNEELIQLKREHN